jgi:hypothetical protein
MFINYGVKIFRLSLIILNVSLFLGLFWYIICDLTVDVKKATIKDYDKRNPDVYNMEDFISTNDLKSNTGTQNTIILMYFAFTSLSTVGFGDYNPRSDEERFICAFILLFGVAIFSYFMGILFEIIENFRKLNEDLDDGDELTRFFGLLRHFNNNAAVDDSVKSNIEQHFDYRWMNDKNQAIDDEDEIAILE